MREIGLEILIYLTVDLDAATVHMFSGYIQEPG